jgi:hypothetical protein
MAKHKKSPPKRAFSSGGQTQNRTGDSIQTHIQQIKNPQTTNNQRKVTSMILMICQRVVLL